MKAMGLPRVEIGQNQTEASAMHDHEILALVFGFVFLVTLVSIVGGLLYMRGGSDC